MLEEAHAGTQGHGLAYLCWPHLACRFAATKGSAFVRQTGRAKTAASTTLCPHPLQPGRPRDIKVRLKPAGVLPVAHFPCLSLPTKPCPPPQVPAAPTSSSAPSPGLSWSQPSSWAARAGDLSKRHILPRFPSRCLGVQHPRLLESNGLCDRLAYPELNTSAHRDLFEQLTTRFYSNF